MEEQKNLSENWWNFTAFSIFWSRNILDYFLKSLMPAYFDDVKLNMG